MMRNIILIFIVTSVSLQLSGQDRIVTGHITDDRKVSIVGPTVCQVNTTNCTRADQNGIFHLLLLPEKEMTLKVECLGFNPVEVLLDESTEYPLEIVLTPSYIPGDLLPEMYGMDNSTGITMRSALSIEAIFTDFDQFSTELGSYNTDAMDYFAVSGPELGVSFNRVYAGLGLGMGYRYNNDNDTLVIDLNTTSYTLCLGYDLVKSSRIRLTPLLSFKWLRFKLLNYQNERRIPLSQYLDERNLDLRFNQTAVVAGINLEYLMYRETYGKGDYWSIGAFGGYAAKLNRKPWIYAGSNRLITENEIGLKHLTFGFSVSFYSAAK